MGTHSNHAIRCSHTSVAWGIGLHKHTPSERLTFLRQRQCVVLSASHLGDCELGQSLYLTRLGLRLVHQLHRCCRRSNAHSVAASVVPLRVRHTHAPVRLSVTTWALFQCKCVLPIPQVFWHLEYSECRLTFLCMSWFVLSSTMFECSWLMATG